MIKSIKQTLDEGKVVKESGLNPSTNYLRIITLLQAIKEYGFDVALGGTRRDEKSEGKTKHLFTQRRVWPMEP